MRMRMRMRMRMVSRRAFQIYINRLPLLLLLLLPLHFPLASAISIQRHLLQIKWSMLQSLSSPMVGSDGRVYACVDNKLNAYNADGTLSLTANLNDTCQTSVAPVVNKNGTVYVAANQNVIAVSDFVEVSTMSIRLLYNRQYGLGSQAVTGLALAADENSLLVNSGSMGLFSVGTDGTLLWNTNGYFHPGLFTSSFKPEAFCSGNSSECYFHFSPAIDLCNGGIYVVHANGWLYAIDGRKPYIKWCYNLEISGDTTAAGVTAGNNGHVYVASVSGILYDLDTDTGNLLWRVAVGPLTMHTCFPRIDTEGRVFVGSLDGFLYAVSPDGSSMQRYLSDSASDSIIQSCPYLDCTGEAIFVSQVRLKSKLISKGFESTEVSYYDTQEVKLFMLDPSSGSLIKSASYSDLSTGGTCNAADIFIDGKRCVTWTFVIAPGYLGYHLEARFITLPLLLLIFGIGTLILYLRCEVRLKHQHKQGQAVKKPQNPVDKQVLLEKRSLYEIELLHLESSLLANPKSTSLREQLQSVLQKFYTTDWLLSELSGSQNQNFADSFPIIKNLQPLLIKDNHVTYSNHSSSSIADPTDVLSFRNGDTRFLNILNLDNGIVHGGEITVDIDHKVNIPAGETDMCHIGEFDWISAETELTQQCLEGSLEEVINLKVDNGDQDKEESSQRKDFGMVNKNDEMLSLLCFEQWNPNLERSQRMISLIQEECPNNNVWSYIIEFETATEEEDQINFYDETAFMDSATTTHRHSILESTMRLPVFESGQQLIPPEYSHRKSCSSAHLPLDKFVLEYVKAEFEAVDTENLHLKLEVVEGLQGGWNGYCVLEGENDRDGRIEDEELFCGSDSQDHHTEKEGHHIQRHGLSTTDGFKENKDTIQKILSSIIDGLECSKQEDFRLDGSGNVMTEERKKTLTMESQFSDDGKTFEPSDTTILRGPLTDPGSCLSETKDNMAAPESRSISMESMNNRNSQECAPGVFAAVEQESSFEKGSCSSYTMEAASHDINLLESSISQQLVLNESPSLNKNDMVDAPESLLNAEGSLSLRIEQENEITDEITVNEETADFNNSVTESREDSLVGSSMGLQPLDNVSDIESNFQEALLQPGSLSEAENRESNSEDLIGHQIQDEGEGTSLGSSSYYMPPSANRPSSASRQSSSSSSSNDWGSSESDSSSDLESSAEFDSDADSESS